MHGPSGPFFLEQKMLSILTAFILYHFNAGWPWWWAFVILIICRFIYLAAK